MSKIIKLPAGTKEIPVYEIPSLLASTKGTTSLLMNLEKKVASSEQTLPLSDDDAKRLTEIWGFETDLNVLFRITKEKWFELESTFNSSENKPDWSLVPSWEEHPNPVIEKEFHKSIDNFIAYGKGDFKLTVCDPITEAPKNDPDPEAYVRIEEFIRYARIVHRIDVQLECEQDLVKTEALLIAQTDGINANTDARSSEVNPWSIVNPEDPVPEQQWYTPARYFARQLVRDDSTLLIKRKILAKKTSDTLFKAKIFGRKKNKALDAGTILKAFNKVSLG